MVKVFSWLIVASFILFFIPILNLLGGLLFIVGSIGLTIAVINERIKDKKEEDAHDISKY